MRAIASGARWGDLTRSEEPDKRQRVRHAQPGDTEINRERWGKRHASFASQAESGRRREWHRPNAVANVALETSQKAENQNAGCVASASIQQAAMRLALSVEQMKPR